MAVTCCETRSTRIAIRKIPYTGAVAAGEIIRTAANYPPDASRGYELAASAVYKPWSSRRGGQTSEMAFDWKGDGERQAQHSKRKTRLRARIRRSSFSTERWSFSTFWIVRCAFLAWRRRRRGMKWLFI